MRASIAVVPTSVLVVDDDPEFRALAVQILARLGLSVVGEAATVDEATRAARKLKPQAALVDIGLPDGDGVALACALATLPWRPRIVLTSTDPNAIAESAAQSAGAAAFIAKQDLSRSALRALLTGSPERE